MDYMKYVDIAYEIALEFKNSDEYKQFILIKDKLLQDFRNEIDKFNEIKEKISKMNKYDLSYNETLNEYLLYKNNFLKNELFLQYQSLEQDLNSKLAEINKKIALNISKNMKYLNEIGLMEANKNG